MHRHLNYASVIATTALFVALGGGAYAATALPKNSVGATQLRTDAVTSSKVKDGSLRRTDFRTSDLVSLRGPAGATGATGATGAAGAKGDKGDKGEAGRSALSTLQSGETVRGVFGVDGVATNDMGNHDEFVTGVTLPIPAPQALGSLDVSVAGGDDDNPACTGTYAAPTAPTGAVCIYPETGATANVDQARGMVPGDQDTAYGFIVQTTAASRGSRFSRAPGPTPRREVTSSAWRPAAPRCQGNEGKKSCGGASAGGVVRRGV